MQCSRPANHRWKQRPSVTPVCVLHRINPSSPKRAILFALSPGKWLEPDATCPRRHVKRWDKGPGVIMVIAIEV